MSLNKCRKCGSKDFIVQEIACHKATLSSHSEVLDVYKEQSGGIDKIFCRNCDEEYMENNFQLINFK